jgi:putative membrane protein
MVAAAYAWDVAPDPDSRARTHLANERTFLAWLRTGITLVALGIAAAQFLGRDVETVVPVVRLLSTLVIGMGAFVVVVGLWRYRTGSRRIDAEAFESAGPSVVIAAGVALVIAVVAIGFVWLLHPA